MLNGPATRKPDLLYENLKGADEAVHGQIDQHL